MTDEFENTIRVRIDSYYNKARNSRFEYSGYISWLLATENEKVLELYRDCKKK